MCLYGQALPAKLRLMPKFIKMQAIFGIFGFGPLYGKSSACFEGPVRISSEESRSICTVISFNEYSYSTDCDNGRDQYNGCNGATKAKVVGKFGQRTAILDQGDFPHFSLSCEFF